MDEIPCLQAFCEKKGTNLKILLIGLYRVSSTRTAPFEDRAEVNPFEEQSQ